MDNILSILGNVARELGLPVPSSAVGSNDAQVKQLLQCAKRTIRTMRDSYDWPECNREYTFSMAANAASYALPQDFDRFVGLTLWNRTRQNPLYGPLTPGDWQKEKSSGISTAGINTEYRIKGVADNQFYIHPTPTTDTDGMVYEYQSKNCTRPKNWVASTSVVHNAYAFNDGGWYQNYTGGTTGTTGPTHSSGSVSDGGVTWSAIGTAYESFVADTDEPLLSSDIVELGTAYRYLQANRLEYQDYKDEYTQELHKAKPAKLPASPLSMQRTKGRCVPWPHTKDNNIL